MIKAPRPVTIHFALAEGRLRPRLSPAGARAALVRPANDNAPVGFDLRRRARSASTRPCASSREHGIGAAAHARSQAENAFFAGDRETYRWWLGMCRTLDRRMAAGLARDGGKTANRARKPR